MKFIAFSIFFCFSILSIAQTTGDTTKIAEEDFSMYADVVESSSDKKTKVFATQKIIGLSPSKLISLGFDYVGTNSIDVDTIGSYLGSKADVSNNTGFRFAANFPVVSNTKMILNLGLNYLDFKYKFDKSANTENPLVNSLSNNGLRSYGIMATLFKPFNEKCFALFQLAVDHNSSGTIDQFFTTGLRVSGAALFGKKPHDRLQYAFGLTQTYRGGALFYIPVMMYNYTFKSRKWGIEVLLPARANVRYTFNARNLLFAGFELEGASYLMNPMLNNTNLGYTTLQLHRSEIRPRLTYEFSIYKFFWMSMQAGYRLGYNFNIDDVPYIAKPVIMQNNVNGSYYFMVSINLVSP